MVTGVGIEDGFEVLVVSAWERAVKNVERSGRVGWCGWELLDGAG